MKIFAVETEAEAFKKIFADEVEFVDLTKDAQIKKISSTTVTSEELEMLTSD